MADNLDAHKSWITNVWRDNLSFFTQWQAPEYAGMKLFEKLPQEVLDYYPRDAPLHTHYGKAKALKSFCGFHRGEVVEVSPLDCQWRLCRGRCPTQWAEQFYCLTKQKTRVDFVHPDFEQLWEFGQHKPDGSEFSPPALKEASRFYYGRSHEVMPDFGAQMVRYFMSCRGIVNYHWRRCCLCTTLGHMFLHPIPALLARNVCFVVLVKDRK